MAKVTKDHPELAFRAESFQRNIRLLRATMIDSLFGAVLLWVGRIFDGSALRWGLPVLLVFLSFASFLAWKYVKHEYNTGIKDACAAANV